MSTKITRSGKFAPGQFVEHVMVAREDGGNDFLPRGLFVHRVLSSRYWSRDLLEDCDEFDRFPGYESELEVEEREIDATPRFGLSASDPRYAFAPWPGTWFRFQGQLFEQGYNGITPLGGDSGIRPAPEEAVEIVKRENSDYHVQNGAAGAVVTIDHPWFFGDGAFCRGPGRFKIESAFLGSDFGHHAEVEIGSVKGAVAHGRVSVERGRRWIWDVEPQRDATGREIAPGRGHVEWLDDPSAARYTLQLAAFPCPVLTITPISE